MDDAFSSSSYWLDHTPESVALWRSTESLPESADVVVIGAGITGASTAYHLSCSGISCVLVDARGICGGATGRNGGFLTPGIADSLSNSIAKYGLTVTKELYEYTQTCTTAIEEFVAENGIDCELRFKGEAILAATSEEAERLRAKFEILIENFDQDITWWDAEQCELHCKSSDFFGGIFKKRCGNLWPSKLVSGLVRKAESLGANVQSSTKVLSVTNSVDLGSNDCIVKTDRGDIKSRSVVHATNAWASDLLPFLKDIIVPVRNQVIITNPQPAMWEFGLCANEGYEYFMQRPDGRIVLGGMRNLSETAEWNSSDELNPHLGVSRALRAYLPMHFRDLSGVRIEQEWIGILGFSVDRNPLIGPLNNRPGEFIAAGFSGHGMPYTFLAGKNIADMITGIEPSPFISKAFLPGRFGL